MHFEIIRNIGKVKLWSISYQIYKSRYQLAIPFMCLKKILMTRLVLRPVSLCPVKLLVF